jgi:membrane-associated phospholipid phosphatase
MRTFLESLETGWGLDVVVWFQGGGGGVLWYLLYPFYLLGTEFGVMLLLAAVFWAVDRRAGIRLMLLVLGSQVLSNIFKVWWWRPRPYHVAPERVLTIDHTWQPGLPSGHTIFGTAAGLWCANTYGGARQPGSRSWWPVFAGVAFALVMGVSRLVHGAHYPQDVISGWVIGAVFFALFLLVERLVIARAPEWRPVPVLLTTVTVLVAVFVVSLLVNQGFEPRKSILAPAGALAGGVVGLLVERRTLHMSTDGSVVQRLLRLVVGLPILAGAALGLSAAFYAVVGESESVPTLVLYVLRYGLLGGLVTLGAPWVFGAVGIAHHRTRR